MDNLFRSIDASPSGSSSRSIMKFPPLSFQSLLPPLCMLASLALCCVKQSGYVQPVFRCYSYISNLRGVLASSSEILSSSLTPGSIFLLANLIVLLIYVMSTCAAPEGRARYLAGGGAKKRSQAQPQPQAEALIMAEYYYKGEGKGSLNASDCMQRQSLEEKPWALQEVCETGRPAMPGSGLDSSCRPPSHDNGVAKGDLHVTCCAPPRSLGEEARHDNGVAKGDLHVTSGGHGPEKKTRSGGAHRSSRDNGLVRAHHHVGGRMQPQHVQGEEPAKYMVRSKSDESITRLRDADRETCTPDHAAHSRTTGAGLPDSPARGGKMPRVRTIEHGLSSMLITDHHHHHNHHHSHSHHRRHHRPAHQQQAQKLSTRRVPIDENLSNDELNQRFTDFINRRFAQMKQESLVLPH